MASKTVNVIAAMATTAEDMIQLIINYKLLQWTLIKSTLHNNHITIQKPIKKIKKLKYSASIMSDEPVYLTAVSKFIEQYKLTRESRACVCFQHDHQIESDIGDQQTEQRSRRL